MLVAVDQSRSMTLCASHDQHIRQRTLQAVRFAARRNLAANPQVSSSTSSQSQQSFKYVKAISSHSELHFHGFVKIATFVKIRKTPACPT